MTEKHQLTCAEAFSRLDDYVDRELSADEIAAVEGHLEQCRICTDEFDTEQQLLGIIRAKLSQIRVPPDLMSKISERLAKE